MKQSGSVLLECLLALSLLQFTVIFAWKSLAVFQHTLAGLETRALAQQLLEDATTRWLYSFSAGRANEHSFWQEEDVNLKKYLSAARYHTNCRGKVCDICVQLQSVKDDSLCLRAVIHS
jgi:hypothetical protein